MNNRYLFEKVATTQNIENVYNLGIYFKNIFENKKYFEAILEEHTFQTLTESNKPNNALRKGIYITNVTENNNETTFNLLRCSSNFEGPTDNFRQTDKEIINTITEAANPFFSIPLNLNHVLAQVYYNNLDNNKKAKIKEHSDKTKDMDLNGVMVFCTFYNSQELEKLTPSTKDIFDKVYKETSGLTKITFRIKNDVKDTNLPDKFTLKLYPNSALVIPLSTNMLYTHEIIPGSLDASKLPTRMGYVIRCSNVKAVHTDNGTYILNGSERINMVAPYSSGISKLKTLYFLENTTSNLINYGNTFNFSLNSGDYLKPFI